MNGENPDLMSYRGCRPTYRGRHIDRYEYVSQTKEGSLQSEHEEDF